MSLTMDDLPRDPERLLRQLQQMVEVVASERSRIATLEIEQLLPWTWNAERLAAAVNA